MYAVIHSGGKQYRVADGLKLKLEKLPADSGQEVEFDKVLMVVDGEKVQLGAPYLSNAKVTATVCGHGRHDKIKIVKLRRRKHYRRQQGHRQDYTEVEITGIQAA